jgi:hypothetical protein
MTKRTRIFWLLAVIVIAVAVFIGVHSGWKSIKKDLAKQPQEKSSIKPLIQDELKRMLIAATDSLYQVQFAGFTLNIDSGKGLIKGIRLIPDSAVYQKLVLQHKAPDMMMNIKADSMVIDHFEFVKTNDGRQFVINNLLLQNPSVHIDHYPQSYNDTADAKSNSLLTSAVKKLMQLSVIKHMQMNNANLEMVNHSGASIKKTALRNLDIAMDGMDVKQVRRNDSSKETKTVITLAAYHLTTADKLYKVHMTNMQINPDNGTSFIKKAVVEPVYSKANFFQHVNKANDRYYLEYNDMQMQGIDITRLLQHQQIKISKMITGSSVTDIYTDYALSKRKPPVRKHKFPHELLQQLAFDITIDTMLMHNGSFKYEIKARASDSTAIFKMDNMESKIINVTNNTAAKNKNHFTTVTSTASVMNSADITTAIKFNLNDHNGAFTITSKLAPMDGRVLNPLTKPLALVEIQSLDIQKMITTISGNEIAAKGNIDFYYRNMKVAMLKKKDDNFKKKKFLSWASNIFIPDDNPKKNGKFKKGPISIQRNPTDSFFGYLWNATFDGMTAHMLGEDKVSMK